MQTIRDRIIQHLQRNPISCVPELRGILGVSQPSVQYHIKLLLEQKIIEPIDNPLYTTAMYENPGRPVKYYRLTSTARPDNFKVLANALLSTLCSDVKPDSILTELAKTISGPALSPQQPLTIRFKSIEARFKDMNYQPHWEVHHDGIRLYFRNCPYHELRKKHPQLCQIDLMMLEHLSGLPGLRESVIGDTHDTIQECIFFFAHH